MELTPRQIARYRSNGGQTWDTRHYDEDLDAFTDGEGRRWRRTAVTVGRYTAAQHAQAELRDIEGTQKAADKAA